MRIVCRREYHRLQRPHSPPTAPMMLRTDCQVCHEPLIEASLPASLLVLSLRGVVSANRHVVGWMLCPPFPKIGCALHGLPRFRFSFASLRALRVPGALP